MPDESTRRPSEGDETGPRIRVTLDPSHRRVLADRAMQTALSEAGQGKRPVGVADFETAAERTGVLDGLVHSLDLEDLGLTVRIDDAEIRSLFAERVEAVTRVFRTLDGLGKDLGDLIPTVPPSFPPTLAGRLVNPDGGDAAYVSVSALEPALQGDLQQRLPWPNPETKTDVRGAFTLSLPPLPIPDTGLTLRVRGANRVVEVQLRRIDLIGDGKLGTVPLDRQVTPLPRSIIAQLGDVLLPTTDEDPLTHPEDFAEPAHPITLGEGDCARSFRSNAGVIDRFSYAMLVRLIAPNLSSKRLANDVRGRDRGRFRMSAASATLDRYADTGQLIETLGQLGDWSLVERVPVEAPIDVEKFLQQVQTDPLAVPKAATLALGYTVRMHQLWIPQGLSLGDLVYSLPLAPGEQQRIAVSEERETLSVRDQESLSEAEQQSFRESADTSTSAVFSSALDESAEGGSEMRTQTKSGSIGGGLGVGGFFGKIVAGLGVAGGYANSTTTGETSSWQSASRDYVSNASQAFHSSLARQASARRNASRASVRLAASTESREVVTKVITNHNHNHALTMQYWQVLRHYGVTSSVDDVQLVCFVPLELVRWLPPGMPRMLPTGNYTRNLLLYRYQALLRHHDVIASRVARNAELRHGLRVLRNFAGDPTMTPDSSSGAAQDVIEVSIRGTFLPFEDVYATAVTHSGARVGPVMLSNNSPLIPSGQQGKAGLVQLLRDRRNATFEDRIGSLTLPSHVPASTIARFEFSRRWRPFSYKLSLPGAVELGSLATWLSASSRLDVHLGTAELESEIGSPLVNDPVARLNGETVIEAYNGPGGTDRMPVVLPVSAKRIPPELSFADLLRIEALLRHVVENAVPFSKAVWQALTPEERAIMLEPYTIGVPSGGISDEADEVPLLNCVANEVLGYFGNAALMPFFIPEPLAREIEFTSRDIQEALLNFHRQAYQPAQSSITLPARGVLGEAVLGSCNSSEKIDLTRFWNWQDSPADEATDLASVVSALGSDNQLVGPTGAQAPSNLQTGSMITLNQGAPAFQQPDLLKALLESLPDSSLPKDLTGIQQLGAQAKVQTETTAETLRKTITDATGLAKAAMDALPHVVTAKKAGEAKKEEGKEGKEGKEGEAKGGGKGDGAADGGKAPTS